MSCYGIFFFTLQCFYPLYINIHKILFVLRWWRGRGRIKKQLLSTTNARISKTYYYVFHQVQIKKVFFIEKIIYVFMSVLLLIIIVIIGTRMPHHLKSQFTPNRRRKEMWKSRTKEREKVTLFYIPKKILLSGSREKDEVACFFVFSHIRIRGYFRLGNG